LTRVAPPCTIKQGDITFLWGLRLTQGVYLLRNPLNLMTNDRKMIFKSGIVFAKEIDAAYPT